ncbi:MAG: archaellin/type IV pilin N-terminal domain-containing protein [Candidatus Bathyarchaeia archaeon]
MKKKLRMNRKGISTVIATIIIVAIAIVMSIAVAYWVMGIGGSFTRFEKLQFTSAWANTNSSSGWAIYMMINNTGSAPATIIASNILYNGKPASAYATPYSDQPKVYLNGTLNADVSLNPGQGLGNAIVSLPSGTGGSDWSSGMTVEITIQTAAGNQYPKTIQLP